MITLTSLAAQKVQEALDASESGATGLRVGVRGGGCSGFQYALGLDVESMDDEGFEDKGIDIIVSYEALDYVDGSEIDWVESFEGSGFEVKNPNAVASCGCGSSFHVATEAPSCGHAL